MESYSCRHLLGSYYSRHLFSTYLGVEDSVPLKILNQALDHLRPVHRIPNDLEHPERKVKLINEGKHRGDKRIATCNEAKHS